MFSNYEIKLYGFLNTNNHFCKFPEQKGLLSTLMLWMREEFRGKTYPILSGSDKNHRLTLNGQKAEKKKTNNMTTKITE